MFDLERLAGHWVDVLGQKPVLDCGSFVCLSVDSLHGVFEQLERNWAAQIWVRLQTWTIPYVWEGWTLSRTRFSAEGRTASSPSFA